MAALGQLHQLHALPLDIGHSVEAGKTLVEEGRPAEQKIGGGQTLSQQVREEHLCLPLNRLAEVVVEEPFGPPPASTLVALVVADDHDRIQVEGQLLDVAGLQPLADKVFHEGIAPLVGDHAAELGVELCPQPALTGECQQLLVGHRAPEKIGEPRSSIFVDQLCLRAEVVALLLDTILKAKEKPWRGDHRGGGSRDPVFEGRALASGGLGDRHQPTEGEVINRPAVAPIGQTAEGLAKVAFVFRLICWGRPQWEEPGVVVAEALAVA